MLSRALQLYQLMRLGALVLTSVALAKSGLGTAEIGTYELLLYLGTATTFFWLNGLLQGLPPVYARLPEGERPALVFQTFALFVALAAGLAAVLLLGEPWITPALTGQPRLEFYRLFVLYLLFNLPAFPVEYFYLLRERPRALLVWGALSFGLQLAAVYVPVRLGGGLGDALLALTVLAAARCAWAVGLVARWGRPAWTRAPLAGYLVFAAPLMLNTVVANLVILYDNWLVGAHYADEAVFAIYRYGSRELPLATALATALGTAMIPRLTAEPGAGLLELRAKSLRLFHAVFPFTIVLLFFTKPLFPWVFNSNFAASAALFNIYLLMTASRVLLPNSIVLARGAPRVILVVGLLELAVKIVLGWVFIRWWGLPGLAWSAVLAYWVEKLGLILWLEGQAGVPTRAWLDWRWYLGYVAVLGGAYALAGHLN